MRIILKLQNLRYIIKPTTGIEHMLVTEYEYK